MSKPTVLVIDDMHLSLISLITLLQEDYNVFAAISGQEGIDIAKKTSPDIILLDVVMPEMDGYEVISVLKNDPETGHIPIVLVTAKDDPNDEVKGLLLGAVDYITKPVNAFAVKLRIGNLISFGSNKDNANSPQDLGVLSGLTPRKYYFENIESQWLALASSNGYMSFIIFKLCNFKGHTERHGNQKGEIALNDLRTIIIGKFSSKIEVGRWRGDELAIALPNTSKNNAMQLVEEICEDFEKYSSASENNIADGLSIKAGIASAAPSQDNSYTFDDYILEACVSLSNAKRGITTSGSKHTANVYKHRDVIDTILALNLNPGYNDMLDVLLTKMMGLTNSEAGTLYMLDEGVLHFNIVKNNYLGTNNTVDDASNWPPIPLDGANIENISAYSAINQQIVAIEDVYSDTKFNFQGTKNYDSLIGYRTKSMLVIPLIVYNDNAPKVVGVIQLINAVDPVTQEIVPHESTASISMITALSRIAANALANKIHRQEISTLYDLSLNDALTELGNRRYFNNVLNQEWLESEQNQSPLSFLLLDVDHFKKINDVYGHFSGDLILKGVADVLKKSLRTSDPVARWGGEEFAILLSDTPPHDALKVAEAVRLAIEDADFIVENDVIVNITMSVGVHTTVVMSDSVYTLANFLSDADAALYQAKKTGRNRVCAFSGE